MKMLHGYTYTIDDKSSYESQIHQHDSDNIVVMQKNHQVHY
jgi:hypothetical protein